MSVPRKPLTGVLPGGNGDDDIFNRFDEVEAADDFRPLPKGAYVAVAVSGRLDKARTGTDGYTVEFRIVEGEYVGRRIWMTKYLTPAAMSYSKRDLAKLGIDSAAKLRGPFPADRFVCKLTVALRTGDDGTERNEIKHLELLRVQDLPVDPFGPGGDGDAPTSGDTDFPFGANAGGLP